MAYSLVNTQGFKDKVEKDNGIAALEKARKLEEQRTKNGWRNIKVNKRLTLFVPCDNDGKPTKEGAELIKQVLDN